MSTVSYSTGRTALTPVFHNGNAGTNGFWWPLTAGEALSVGGARWRPGVQDELLAQMVTIRFYAKTGVADTAESPRTVPFGLSGARAKLREYLFNRA